MAESAFDMFAANASATRRWLEEPFPADPFPALNEWLLESTRHNLQPNPNAFALSTIDADGRPSSRIVLCRGVDEERGFLTFFTNKQSRKGEAIAAHGVAAALFHWDHMHRQIRIEGPVTHAPGAESDAYFATRHPLARVGAHASDQSRPIASRRALDEKVRQVAARFGLDAEALDEAPLGTPVDVARPPHWGGYRVWAERVELWIGRPGRIHDRALWTRDLRKATAEESGETVDVYEHTGGWRVERLQP